jgi:thymidine kinase
MTNPRLKIIFGPMFSGKTTELISLYQKSFSNKKVIINHTCDQRYSKVPAITSHDLVSLPAISTENIKEILNDAEIMKNDEFYIDEGQFHDDLYYVVTELMKLNKKIIISGLDGDFKMNPFKGMDLLRLIPFANDGVEKMTANCYICNQPASYTKKISGNSEQNEVGEKDKYQPTCYLHH